MAGEIVHIEYPASNTDRAAAFWGGLFGWEFGPSMSEEVEYRMARTGETSGGAILNRDAGSALDLDCQLVETLVALDDELVVRLQALDGEEHALDLAREDVHAADDEHVVRAPLHPRHARERSPARARLARQRREVARAVPQQRHRLLRQRREHELALGGGRAGLRVDRLDEEVV